MITLWASDGRQNNVVVLEMITLWASDGRQNNVVVLEMITIRGRKRVLIILLEHKTYHFHLFRKLF